MCSREEHIFEAHRHSFHSILGLRVIKKKEYSKRNVIKENKREGNGGDLCEVAVQRRIRLPEARPVHPLELLTRFPHKSINLLCVSVIVKGKLPDLWGS